MTWQLASFVILGLVIAAGFGWYERSHPSARVLALVSALAALAIAVLYAVSDEFHQSFVEGRNGSPLDVGIDTVGAAISARLLWRRG